MPKLTKDEIKERIADASIFAIAIDTAVVDGLPGQLDNAILKTLVQFHARGIRILFSEIVAEEIKRHVALAAKESQHALNRAMRQQRARWKISIPNEIREALALEGDANELATAQFESFIRAVHGELVPATEMAELPSEVLRRYFAETPPFGRSGKRKHEFPDAFALLTLEALARDEDKLLLCVSPDKGWQDFSADSACIVCVDHLEDVLSYFNEVHQAIAEEIVAAWRAGAGEEFIGEISRAFEYRLDDLDFHPTGNADVDFESEPIEAVLQYVDPQEIGEPTAIAADADTITFIVPVEALISFTAQFNFYVVDGIDHDEVPLGSEEASVEKRVRFDLTITADRPLEGEPVFHEVEVASQPFEVDFGYVEAFPRDNPEHEKY
ncbi:MAG: hypothetical protein GEU76_15430 [Alphaproteobacteria bacterium]|nr:hypothetical protein [Alphaproteobacteria bacterium]